MGINRSSISPVRLPQIVVFYDAIQWMLRAIRTEPLYLNVLIRASLLVLRVGDDDSGPVDQKDDVDLECDVALMISFRYVLRL